MHSYINIFTQRTVKKQKAIIDSICISLINSNITKEDFETLIADINNNAIVNLSILSNGGNLWTTMKSNWIPLAKDLFSQRSVGIGTPNAASGEGELMFLFLAGTKVKKPTQGDLEINNKKYELKGDGPRLQSDISGNNFRQATVQIAKKYNLSPNLSSNSSTQAVELEKMQHNTHWEYELSKLPLVKQKEFVNEWLRCIDGNDHKNNISDVYSNGVFDQQALIKNIVKILFAKHRLLKPFDYYVILGDGTDVKVIPNDINVFNSKIDSGEIVICSDYFRVKQNFPIGWYIK